MQYVGQTKWVLKTRFKVHLFNIKKKQRKLIRFFINISGELVIHDHLVKFWFNLLKKLYTSRILPKYSKHFKT